MHPEPAVREPRFVKILVLCTAITRLENRRSPMSFSQIRSLMSFSTYVRTYIGSPDSGRGYGRAGRSPKHGPGAPPFSKSVSRRTVFLHEEALESGGSSVSRLRERRLSRGFAWRTMFSPNEFLGKPQLSNHGPGVTDIAYAVLPFLTPRNLAVLAAGEFVIRRSSSINKVW